MSIRLEFDGAAPSTAQERIRVALISMISDIAREMLLAGSDTMPWFIDDSRGTVRDNAGALIAYIDPTALHLVAQLQAYGVA